MIKKIMLVCGATGFIGRNIVEFYSKDIKYDVIAVYNKQPPFECPGVRWIQADLTDQNQVKKILVGVNILVQAAAVTSGIKDVVERPYIHITDNAVMNSYIFRSAYELELEHVVFFSCTVMLQSSEKPQSENDLDANAEVHSRYFGIAWTKFYLEKMCEFYSRLGRTKYTAIRHSNVYGPYDKYDLERSHVFGATVTKVMTADDSVTVWGTGDEARDLLYVDDIVDMVNRIIEKQPGNFGIYNCGAGVAITIKDLVSRIIAASGKSLIVQYDLSKPTIPTSLCLDYSKAQHELGWQPRYQLDEGVRRTIEWWVNNSKNRALLDGKN
jgi:GDP-L-fucose synthase